MTIIESLVNEYVDQGLKNKKLFSQFDPSKTKLKSTLKSSGRNYLFENIAKPELRALKKLFENIFEDFYSQATSERIWELSYATPEEDNECELLTKSFNPFEVKSEEPIAINCNKLAITKFVRSLLNKADSIFKSSNDNEFISKHIIKASRIFLIGDVGIGKTTFLKFAYAFNRDLIENKFNTFWVHIDFTKNIYRTQSIEQAIKDFSSRQFRQRYFDKMNYKEKKSLKNFLRTYFIVDGKTDEEIEKDFENCYIKFAAKYEKQHTKPFDERIQTGISDYIEQKQPVIYILDGLDDIDSKEIYSNILKDIHNIMSDEDRKGTFIFVMRNESHSILLNDYSHPSSNIDEAKLYSDSPIFTIKPAKLNKIISKRLDLMIELMDRIITNNAKEIFDGNEKAELNLETSTNNLILKLKNFFHNKERFEAYIDFLLIYLHKGIQFGGDINFDEWSRIKSVSELKNLIGNNYRKLMRAINVVHTSFLENLGSIEKPFDKIENIHKMILNERSDFFDRSPKDNSLKTFKSIVGKDYRVIEALLQKGSSYTHPYHYYFDKIKNSLVRVDNNNHSSFIYSIFYPVNTFDYKNEIYNLLLKIRILQLMNYYFENKNGIKLQKEEISNHIHNNFPYEKERIDLAIDELLDIHLLSMEYSNYGYYLTITRVGINHIENLLYNFQYIRIIMDDMIFPDIFLAYFLDTGVKEKNKSIWILKQIPRVSMFLLLVSIVEEWEAEKRAAGEIKWNISEKMKESIIKVIVKICVAHDPNLDKLKTYFKKHFNRS